jgi:flagellar basal-body rod protein FlgB
MATKALDLRSRRHEMIISNIANADTPNYKSFDLLVEEALQKSGDNDASSVSLKRTHPGHLPSGTRFGNQLNAQVIQPEAIENLRGDGNTVDMDREMSNLAANQVLYKATTRILSDKFQGLKNAIKGGTD